MADNLRGTASEMELHPEAPEPNWELRSRRAKLHPERIRGSLRLAAEREWVLTGETTVLDDVVSALPDHAERLGPQTVLLRFGNAVGHVDLPHLGQVEVMSGKWGEEAFDRMLAELVEIASNLPFSAGEDPSLPFLLTRDPSPRIPYHAFVYLRHVLSDHAPRGERLLPALELVVRDPHRRWRRESRHVPLEAMTRVDAETVSALLTAPLSRPEPGSDVLEGPVGQLAGRLGGQLPTRVVESRVLPEVDTDENRLVKRFLDESLQLVGQVERLASDRGGAFGGRLLEEAERCGRRLGRVRRHPLWAEVGEAHRVPAASTVLRQRRGYRETFRHWVRLRRTAELPLEPELATSLLEVKDIATLYELWCYFQVVSAASELLGEPVRASRVVGRVAEAVVPWEFAVEWNRVRVVYNAKFRRHPREKLRTSYSAGLRPDVVIENRRSSQPTIHVMDAKFRIRRIRASKTAKDVQGKKPTATFKRADLYKMHAYRDAIVSADTAWVVYPGTEFSWYSRPGSRTKQGVGAVPLTPARDQKEIENVLARLLE